MDPFKPTVNKPGTLAWLKEIFIRWVKFFPAAVKELLGKAKSK